MCVEVGMLVVEVGATDGFISLTLRYLFLGSARVDWIGETDVVAGMFETVGD
jgi:hypothetical protein